MMKTVKLFRDRGSILLLLLLAMGLFIFAQRIEALRETQNSLQGGEAQQSRIETVCTEQERLTEPLKCQSDARTEKHRLFDELMLHSTLVKVATDGSIVLPTRDYLLLAESEGREVEEVTRRLVERLYGTIAGKAVQQQVALWNHSRRFSAVRDNVPQVNTSAVWVAKDEASGTKIGHSNVPLDYGFVNAGNIPQHYNDWISVTGQDKIIFERQIDPKEQARLTLQVIGQPDVQALSPHTVKIETCRWLDKKASCQVVTKPSPDISVYRLEVTLARSARSLQTLRLPVQPAYSEQFSVDGLSIHIKPEETEAVAALAPEKEHFAWSPLKAPVIRGGARQDAFNFTIATSKGTLLFDSVANKPSQFARDQGLLSLVGYESQDRFSLAGQIAQANLGTSNTEVRLTIEDELQQSALKNLKNQLKIIDPEGRYNDERRAAVVFLKPKTGAILAAASYPNPPSDVNRWDRLSFSKLFPNKDKFSVHAWQGLDNNNTPGSVFKIVTSLAGLKAAEEGNSDVRQMIRGLKANEFRQLTGLAVTESKYQPDPNSTTVVNNSSNVPLLAAMPHNSREGTIIRPPLRSTRGKGCPATPVVSKDLGLREAVRSSLNTWFVRLGVMMDQSNLDTGGKDTQLATMAEALNFGEKLPLAQVGTLLNPSGELTNHRGRGSVLTAFTGSLTLASNSNGIYARGDALQRLSQNSFGQGVATTPLQIARVSSLVATGDLTWPYLLKAWGGEMLQSPESKKIQPDDIDLLRAGMKAVPEVGTARSAFSKHFPDGKCRTYGKTGTAQVAEGAKKSTRYSAWFTGWMDSEQGVPEVVFSCMVTHTYRAGHNYGGDVCGPIIAKTLSEMSQRPAKQEATK